MFIPKELIKKIAGHYLLNKDMNMQDSSKVVSFPLVCTIFNNAWKECKKDSLSLEVKHYSSAFRVIIKLSKELDFGKKAYEFSSSVVQNCINTDRGLGCFSGDYGNGKMTLIFEKTCSDDYSALKRILNIVEKLNTNGFISPEHYSSVIKELNNLNPPDAPPHALDKPKISCCIM
jgi:hypothetical protein